MAQFAKDYPGGFVDGPTGGTPITAQVENNIEQGIADEDVRNPSSPATLALAGLYGHDVRAWAPTTQYAAGQAVVNPSGDVVTAKAAFTSAASYDATNWNLSTTFAANTYPAKQTFDTLDAQALRYWRIALANRNSAPANIFHLGDSITWGYAANPYSLAGRWASVLRDTLRSRFPNTTPVAGGFGFMSPRQTFGATAFTDATVTNTGGSDTSNMSYGVDGRSRILAATGDKQHYTFTGTGIDLLYVIYGGGGTFSYSVDGGAATNVSTNGTANNAGKTSITGLTAGAHTVDVTWVSGGSVFYSGIMVYNGDESAGIRSWVAAWPGTKATDWWNNGTAVWWDHMVNVQPALVTIELGPNDFGNTPIATFTSTMQSLIAKIKTKCGYVPSFVLTPTWPLNPTSPPDPWSSFVNAMYQIAATDPDGAVCVFDWQARTTSTPATTAGGLLDPTDKTHLTPVGNRYIAESFAQFLAPR